MAGQPECPPLVSIGISSGGRGCAEPSYLSLEGEAAPSRFPQVHKRQTKNPRGSSLPLTREIF